MGLSSSTPSSLDISEEDIHDVLRNRRRRLVIDILKEADSPVSVRELSEQIGAVESGSDPPPRNIKQSVYVSLLQTHLPKLDELNIINYEPDGKTVAVEGGLGEVSIYMETVPKYGITRSEYYAAVSLLGLLTILGAELGVPGLASISSMTWAYGFLLLGFISSLYHSYRQGSTVLHRLILT